MKYTDLTITQRRKIRDVIMSYASLQSHRVVLNHSEKYNNQMVLEVMKPKEGETPPTSIKLYMGLLEEFMQENYELLSHIFEIIGNNEDISDNEDGDDLPW